MAILAKDRAFHDAFSSRFWMAFLLIFFVFFVNFDLLEAVQQSKDDKIHPSNALAFSKRGLSNANRLSESTSRFQILSEGPTIGESNSISLDDFILSDLLIVSSIEGGIYGLDRNTGKIIWSLPPRSETESSTKSTNSTIRNNNSFGFSPLVGTSYGPKQRTFTDLMNDYPLIEIENDQIRIDGSSGKESLEALQELGLYIVEPGSGQVYVLSTLPSIMTKNRSNSERQKTAMSKLPLTLPQLVELSPFSFPGDASRVFVGNKRTSLVELDVRSGKIGAIFGGSQNSGGVWCSSNDKLEENKDANCGNESDRSKEWAYMGRTDYTLTVHLRGRPALSQTLHFSTFSPNSADRDIAELWLSRGFSPDKRTMIGMPEESSILCFDSSQPNTKSNEQKDRTLWISELGATVAGIFDVVYANAPSSSNDYLQPLLLPHPKSSLNNIISRSGSEAKFSPTQSLGRIGDRSMDSIFEPNRATYLGISNGNLFAMGSEQYPMVAFSPRAPASLSANEYALQDDFNREHKLCSSFGCLIGSYDLQGSNFDDLRADELLGLGPGHAPLLGIGDGSVKEQIFESKNEENQVEKENVKDLSSSWSSPTVVTAQIAILFFFAVCCGLLYIGSLEYRRQSAVEVGQLAKKMTWQSVPQFDNKVSPSKSQIGEKTVIFDEKSPDKTLSKTQDFLSESISSAIDQKDIQNTESNETKTSTAKRRRRGKRAGNAVAQREKKKENNQESLAVEKESEIVPDRKDQVIVKQSSGSKGSGLINAEEESVHLVENTIANVIGPVTLDPDGGSKVALTNGSIGILRDSVNKSLIISDEILGYGSSGTIVFKGTFQGRAVAVKRLLRDFVDVASKEVSLLESADNHENVIRYFYKEITESFLYIALELCPASLAEVIEKPNEYQSLSATLKPKKALFQIASGLQHLHSLSIVHRDIKPQNILVSQTLNGELKMLLSDFGLSKRLDGIAQTSFSQTVNNPGGTVGWRAPEILLGDVNLDAGADACNSTSSIDSKSSNFDENGNELKRLEDRKRLTRAIDIFALGCLMYYVLSNGDHPFGSRFEREMNILRKSIDLQRLDGLGEEGYEAQHLICEMIKYEPEQRPNALKILSHPYFWDSNRRLSFLQDASDRFDIMERDPPAAPLVTLELKAIEIIGQDWHRRLDRQVMEDLNKRRKYDPKSIAALLRAIRNKKHHIHDLPLNVKRLFTISNSGNFESNHFIGNGLSHQALLPDGFLAYFTSRFPKLFLHTYEVVDSYPILKSESSFALYFKPLPSSFN